VHSSVYCLPADLLGEGADRVVGTVRARAGVPGVTVAACYHASRDIYPHNPAYRRRPHLVPRPAEPRRPPLRRPPPRPPDTTTPASLAEKAQLARSHNCTELNFPCHLRRDWGL
jgi:hypothetical protein